MKTLRHQQDEIPMLINFCNPNQTISAIDITGHGLTMYHPFPGTLEILAFYEHLRQLAIEENYLYKVAKNEDKQHAIIFHNGTSHIKELSHIHLIFQKKIDGNLIDFFISAVESYQDKNNFANRRILQNKIMNSVSGWLIRFSFFMRGVDSKNSSNIKLISNRNIAKITQQFQEITTSSDSIEHSQLLINLNLINQKDETHYFSEPQDDASLTAHTCSAINNLVAEEAQSSSQFSINSMVFSGTLIAGSLLFKCYQYAHAAARETPSHSPAPRQSR